MKKVINQNAFRKKELLLRGRLPAKDLTDIELKQDVYNPDFQIGEKYSSYSTEIIRLSLVGIAGYGFLISNILMKVIAIPNNDFKLPISNFVIAIIGVISLGFSLALSLYHRFNITSCLYDQILISRSLLRLKNPNWSQEEKEHEKRILAAVRECQKIDAKRFQNILFWSGLFLFIGFISVLGIFTLILTKIL